MSLAEQYEYENYYNINIKSYSPNKNILIK